VRIAALRDRVRDHFLLRRADANEGKARRLSGGERSRAHDGARLQLYSHGRLMPAHVA